MMSKRLIICWGDTILYDGEPEQFSFTESDAAVRVEAGHSRKGSGLLDQIGQALTASSRKQTEQRKAELTSDDAGVAGNSAEVVEDSL